MFDHRELERLLRLASKLQAWSQRLRPIEWKRDTQKKSARVPVRPGTKPR
jgi:hypothetical protein